MDLIPQISLKTIKYIYKCSTSNANLGGLLRKSDNYIKVTCLNVNNVLGDILSREGVIDVLKIDTEGNEIEIIGAILKKFLSKIKVIFFELDYSVDLGKNFKILSEYYKQSRYGNTVRLLSRNV